MRELSHTLRFSRGEFDTEFLEKDWREFQIDMEDGNLLNIEELLTDYYYGFVNMNDILSTFPPSEITHLIPGQHDNLIKIYRRLAEEFPKYSEVL
ncbi:hypothetical protein CLV96_0313 [Leptospira meyeri]|uniref:Uncharacterized protein n=1 Tax=Leptospira meyeri TaxID=29508 RepID=A0A4V3HIC0_LEPME|nr:hypothetical protein CLV96_0313 [Leptospira meyeri]